MSPVGILGCGESDLHIKPTLSRSVVYQWAHSLRYHDFDESTRLSNSIRELSPTLRNRSLVFVLSDLHDEGAVDALKRLSQEHDTVVLQLQDPAERGAVGGGIFRGQEAETGETFVAHGASRWFDHEKIGRELSLAGIDHLLLSTDKPILPGLRHFLKSRDFLGKGER